MVWITAHAYNLLHELVLTTQEGDECVIDASGQVVYTGGSGDGGSLTIARADEQPMPKCRITIVSTDFDSATNSITRGEQSDEDIDVDEVILFDSGTDPEAVDQIEVFMSGAG